MMLSRQDLLTICRNNISAYDGVFFMAVKSTGIYCIASCRAKFPKETNIEFYRSRQDVEGAGYRGCKRCHAAQSRFRPLWLNTLVIYLHDHLDLKLSMADLEGVVDRHRSTITSIFKEHYGLTALEYHRNLKLETAHHRIQNGMDYRDVAFGLGYESVSGFRSAFKQYFDTTPGQLEVLS